MSATALSAVARISYLTSDVLLDVAGNNLRSAFTTHYAKLQAYRPPKLVNVPNGADLSLRIPKTTENASLVTVTLHAERDVLTRLIPSLAALASTPLVLNVAVQGDLSSVLALRTVVDFLVHSNTAEQAHDNALLAARLARTERVIVLHAFQFNASGSLTEVDELKVRPFLEAPKREGTNGTHANGHGGSDHLDSFLSESIQEDSRISQYNEATLATLAVVRRTVLPVHYHGKPGATSALVVLGATINVQQLPSDVGVLEVSLVQPLPTSRILSSLPASLTKVVVLEQIYKWPAKWTPLYLDLLSLSQSLDASHRPELSSGVLGEQTGAQNIQKFVESASSSTPRTRLLLGSLPSQTYEDQARPPHVPKHEAAYTKVLEHVFGERLEVSNSPSLVPSKGQMATKPEYALGRVEAHLAERTSLREAVQTLLGASRDLDLP